MLFNPNGRQYNYKMCEYNGTRARMVHDNALVVPNCMFRHLPTIPCTPIGLALKKARPTEVNAFVQAGSLRVLEILVVITRGYPRVYCIS
jgi:hypothetical protein